MALMVKSRRAASARQSSVKATTRVAAVGLDVAPQRGDLEAASVRAPRSPCHGRGRSAPRGCRRPASAASPARAARRGQVDVGDRPAGQRVAHRAADHPRLGQRRHHRGQAPDRPGKPAAAIRSAGASVIAAPRARARSGRPPSAPAHRRCRAAARCSWLQPDQHARQQHQQHRQPPPTTWSGWATLRCASSRQIAKSGERRQEQRQFNQPKHAAPQPAASAPDAPGSPRSRPRCNAPDAARPRSRADVRAPLALPLRRVRVQQHR